jgi:hypothetical protein
MPKSSPGAGVASHSTIYRPSVEHISIHLPSRADRTAYGMMEVEQWVWFDVPNMRSRRSEDETRGNTPLGVHFGPRVQLGPALNGHMPNKSLSIGADDPDQQKGTKRTKVTDPPTIWWMDPWEPFPPSKRLWKPTKSPWNPSTMSLIRCGVKRVLRGSVGGGFPTIGIKVKFLRMRWGTG